MTLLSFSTDLLSVHSDAKYMGIVSSSAGRAVHISWSKAVCLDANQADENRNCRTHRFVILHAQTY